MSELENIEHDKQVYTKWLCEDKSKPIRAIHWLWEYLETPRQEDNKLTEDDELDILQSFINYKRGNEPSLTIPKSIAEQADKIAYYTLQKEGIEEFRQWFDYKQDGYMDIIYAYLNPLTRDLVKVVADD